MRAQHRQFVVQVVGIADVSVLARLGNSGRHSQFDSKRMPNLSVRCGIAAADDRTHVYVMPQPIHNAFCCHDEGDIMSWFVPPIVVPAFLVLLIVAQGAYLAFSH